VGAVSPSASARLPGLPPTSRLEENEAGVVSREHTSRGADDETLVNRIQLGERDALALLFQRYARLVRNIGKRILEDGAEADDLVQEVFLYIHRKSALFDVTRGCARSWIVQVTYTQALMRRRKLKSHGFYVSVITDGAAEYEAAHAKGIQYELTVEGLFGKNGWKNVWDSLTEFQRETLQLHFYEGCTFAEIAESLGQSYANIRHHYYRALERLRKHANENELKWP
jgi:RNA polymerase sigma-70 factor (ECF subfamily)